MNNQYLLSWIERLHASITLLELEVNNPNPVLLSIYRELLDNAIAQYRRECHECL